MYKKLFINLILFFSFFESVFFNIFGWNLHLYHIVFFLCLIFSLIFNEIKFSKINLVTFLFLFLVFTFYFTSFFSNYFTTAFKASTLLTIYILNALLIYFLSRFDFSLIEYSIEMLIEYCFYFSLILILCYILYSYFGIDYFGAETQYLQSFSDDIGSGSVTRAYGFYANATTGGVTIISIGLLLFTQIILKIKKLNFINFIKLLIFFLAANFTYTRGFFIGLVIALFYLFILYGVINRTLFKSLKLFLISFLFFLVTAYFIYFLSEYNDTINKIFSKFFILFDFSSGSGLYRIEVWMQLVHDFIEHPLLGNGLLYYQVTFWKGGNAESFLLELLSGAGIFSVIFFLGINFLLVIESITMLSNRKPDIKSNYLIILNVCYISLFFGYLSNPGFWTNIPWLIIGLLMSMLFIGKINNLN